MKKSLFFLFAMGLTFPSFGQITKIEELSEVVVRAVNYKYLNNVETAEVASVPVQLLERKAAAYDIKNSDIYMDEYDYYEVAFYIPEGMILAAYDKDGKIIRTAEKFKDISLPQNIRDAVMKRFPGWTITKDIYMVRYVEDRDPVKQYKIKLVNGDEVVRVKLDADGNFL